MRKAKLKIDLSYCKGYRTALDFCLYLIGKDFQPTVIIDCLKSRINDLDKEINIKYKNIYGWSEEDL